MKKSSLTLTVVLTALAIAPILLSSETANAHPDGLNGSYVGITVDANKGLGLGQDFLQQTGSPASWVFNKAIEGNSTSQAIGVTSQPNPSGASEINGQGLQGRIDFKNFPISVRGKFFVGSDSSVIQPMLSYDLAIAHNANIYAGAGYSFNNSKDKTSLPANQNAVLVTAGAEAAVSDKVVIYGDAQYQLNTPSIKETFPVKVQFGFGYRF